MFGFFGQGFVSEQQHASPAGSEYFVAVETKYSYFAEGAGMLPLVITAQAFGSVFDQFYVILSADFSYFVYAAGMAKSVHGHNRSNASSGIFVVCPRFSGFSLTLLLPFILFSFFCCLNTGVLFEPAFQRCRRKAHRIAVHIDKNRMGSAIGYGIDGSHKGQRLGDHFFVAFHPGQLQSQMQGIGSVDANHGFGCSGKEGHCFFEAVNKLAYTRHIGGVDAFPEVFFFVPAEHRRMQRYSSLRLPEGLPDKLHCFGK